MHADVDEPVVITGYDPRWVSWYETDAAELRRLLGPRLWGLEHFGSTAVEGLAGKPIIDILLAPAEWPLVDRDREAVIGLGYETLGEAGVPGREYFRRRREHATNLAVVERDGPLWNDNLAVRDYLRAHPGAAAQYAEAKLRAWNRGARTLLRYSEAKRAYVDQLLEEARGWSRSLSGLN